LRMMMQQVSKLKKQVVYEKSNCSCIIMHCGQSKKTRMESDLILLTDVDKHPNLKKKRKESYKNRKNHTVRIVLKLQYPKLLINSALRTFLDRCSWSDIFKDLLVCNSSIWPTIFPSSFTRFDPRSGSTLGVHKLPLFFAMGEWAASHWFATASHLLSADSCFCRF
jgi:hypothetical protein